MIPSFKLNKARLVFPNRSGGLDLNDGFKRRRRPGEGNGSVPKKERGNSRDNRLNHFFNKDSLYCFTDFPGDEEDSEVDPGVEGQFDDAPVKISPKSTERRRRRPRLNSETNKNKAKSIEIPIKVQAISSRKLSQFGFPDSGYASSDSVAVNMMDRHLKMPTPTPIPLPNESLTVVEGQFDDDESYAEVKEPKKECTITRILKPPAEHYYYQLPHKLYEKFDHITPSVPYPNLGSLHVNHDGHLMFTSNRLCTTSATKGIFWCIKNPLEGLKGSRLDIPHMNGKVNKTKLMNWKLNLPSLDIKGTTTAVGMYGFAITAAKPMANRFIFFGDETGKVGVAWYYFLDELEKFSYKLDPLRANMSRNLKIGLFDVLWTDTKFFINHNSKITCVDVSPRDGRVVVSGASNGSVITWNGDVFQMKHRFSRATNGLGEITSICFQPASLDCFATSCKKGSFLLWDVRSEKPFRIGTVLRGNPYLMSLVWNPRNDRCVIGGTSDGELLRFDIRNPDKPYFMSKLPVDSEVNFLAVHPTKCYLAASSLSYIDHFTGPDLMSLQRVHRGGMSSSVTGLTFYEDYVFSADKNCCMTAFKYVPDIY